MKTKIIAVALSMAALFASAAPSFAADNQIPRRQGIEAAREKYNALKSREKYFIKMRDESRNDQQRDFWNMQIERIRKSENRIQDILEKGK